jgi:1,2-diacylglycerol 3-beta-galactosyltransferase
MRQKLGWPQDRPILLLVGGGEGMGPMERVALNVDRFPLPVCLVVVCGRNQKLKHSLESRQWKQMVKVYGFVHDMPDFMQAADILITKAGPGTITEAINAGLPMLLYSRLPGQEDGNVSYVVSRGAGFWTPTDESLTQALQTWLENPESYQQAVQACRRIARPTAAMDIAKIIFDKLPSKPMIKSSLQP